MGRMGRFDCKGLKDFQQQLGKLQNPDDFVESCAKELAARLLRMVVKRTPVGQYPASSGKKGGTLRRGCNLTRTCCADCRTAKAESIR